MKCARWEPVDHVRVVAEEDPQLGLRIDPGAPGATGGGGTERGSTPTIWTRLPCSSSVRESSEKQRRRIQVVELGRVRERIAGERKVVVAEHGEQFGIRASSSRSRGSPLRREQVAADQRQVRAAPLDPGHRRARPPPSRATGSRGGGPRGARSSALQLRGQPRQRTPERLEPHPPRLEVSPTRSAGAEGGAEAASLRGTRLLLRASRPPAPPTPRGA